MSVKISYSDARRNLASLLDRVTDEQEILVIARRGHKDVALIKASELKSLLETAHLLHSPKNADRLLAALHRAQARIQKPSSIESLTEEFGVEKREKK